MSASGGSRRVRCLRHLTLERSSLAARGLSGFAASVNQWPSVRASQRSVFRPRPGDEALILSFYDQYLPSHRDRPSPRQCDQLIAHDHRNATQTLCLTR